MTASTQARSQDFAQDGATGHFQICEIFPTRFFPYNAHRRNVKVRQSPILFSVNKIAQGGAVAPWPSPWLGYVPASTARLNDISSVWAKKWPQM